MLSGNDDAVEVFDGANRDDCVLLAPTLRTVIERGLLADIDTLHLDRCYANANVRRLLAGLGVDDLVCRRRRSPGAQFTSPSC